jgi:alginate O-acetyltransferase complex protein AlgI
VLFNSALFLIVFLPVFLVLYNAVPVKWRNHVALSFSLIFYTWGAPKFAALLLGTGLVDYFISHAMVSGKRKFWLALGIAINLLVLGFFKYFNFFIDNARLVFEGLGLHFSNAMQIALPLGISFFTFQKVSYLIDVYRADCKPAKNITSYLLFVFLFPQLIAGPIVRYKDIESQILNRADYDRNYRVKLEGFFRFVVGLVKKVLIADQLAPLAESVFATQELGWYAAALGLIAFTFQIYFDFSAYSDMAIGLGLMMGFIFPENFNWPYQAKGFSEFWKRWHITLSTWFKDYLYLPLGGNRRNPAKTFFNLWLVFLLSGLWHGASWNFIIWGVWHGALISIDRYTKWFIRFPSWFAITLTFFFVSLGWIWFRAENLNEAIAYFNALFSLADGDALHVSKKDLTVLFVASIGSFIPVNWLEKQSALKSMKNRILIVKLIVSLLAVLICLGQIANQSAQPFIYFRF